MAIQGIRINRATRDVILRGNYPNLTGDPIPGFEFGGTGEEEWLIVINDNYSGAYDQRYYKIVSSEDDPIDRIEHPSYPGVGQWVIRQDLVKRDLEEILENLENSENLANELVFPYVRQLKIMVIGLRGLARKVLASATLSDTETDALQYIVRLGLKLENNHITMKAKKEIIETEPDMDSGWITEEEPEDE